MRLISSVQAPCLHVEQWIWPTEAGSTCPKPLKWQAQNLSSNETVEEINATFARKEYDIAWHNGLGFVRSY